MQAVIRTGGKQYYVTAGDILEVEKLAGDIGETITLDDVLMIDNDDDVTVGQPTVDDAAVTAKITGQYRGNKILVFRYRPKKRIRVRRGHRQYLTRLEIQSIKFGDLEFMAPEPMVSEPVIEDVVIDTPEIEPVEVEDTSSETVAEATAEMPEAEDNTAVVDTADVDTDAGKAEADVAAESSSDVDDSTDSSDDDDSDAAPVDADAGKESDKSKE